MPAYTLGVSILHLTVSAWDSLFLYFSILLLTSIETFNSIYEVRTLYINLVQARTHFLNKLAYDSHPLPNCSCSSNFITYVECQLTTN